MIYSCNIIFNEKINPLLSKTFCDITSTLEPITGITMDILEKEHYRIVGERSGKIYSLGDTIRIFVKAVDLSKKTIDFGFAREKNQGQFFGKFHESKRF